MTENKPPRFVMNIECGGVSKFFYNPPSWFIPEIVYEFWEMYWYYNKYGGAPSFENRSIKFVALAKEYDRSYYESLKARREK